MSGNLTYYVTEGVLAGTIGTRMFHVIAHSGGGGGSTRATPNLSMNNPYMEGLKTKQGAGSAGHVHGGPLPPGKYMIQQPAHHSHLGLSARLVHPLWRPAGRDGFFIHGRGPHGSDGCIVPLDPAQFKDLMSALTGSKGGVLHVQESMSDTRFA